MKQWLSDRAWAHQCYSSSRISMSIHIIHAFSRWILPSMLAWSAKKEGKAEAIQAGSARHGIPWHTMASVHGQSQLKMPFLIQNVAFFVPLEPSLPRNAAFRWSRQRHPRSRKADGEDEWRGDDGRLLDGRRENMEDIWRYMKIYEDMVMARGLGMAGTRLGWVWYTLRHSNQSNGKSIGSCREKKGDFPEFGSQRVLLICADQEWWVTRLYLKRLQHPCWSRVWSLEVAGSCRESERFWLGHSRSSGVWGRQLSWNVNR